MGNAVSLQAKENERRASREAKRKRTGTCRVCGAVTRYSGRDGRAVSELCPTHAAQESGAKRRGTGSNQARVLDYISEPRRYSEIRDNLGISDAMMGTTIHRLLEYGLIERVSRGVYVRVEK
jgi:hypothetical protein